MKFMIDDQVIIPELGLGMIIGEVDYKGIDCFQIYCRDSVTVTRPKDEMDISGVRFPCSPDEVSKVIKILKGKRETVSAKNNNQLYKKYREQLNSGDVITLAKLVRNLYTKDAGELGLQRYELYEKALRRLTDELVFVLQVSPQGAQGIVESIIARDPLPPEWLEKLKTPWPLLGHGVHSFLPISIYCFKLSRISRRSFTSSDGSFGFSGVSSTGATASWALLIPFTTIKITSATITKSMIDWMNTP